MKTLRADVAGRWEAVARASPPATLHTATRSREQGKAACEFFTQWKTVCMDIPPEAGS